MAARPGLMDYLTAAFNARPLGMFIPPNWVGVSAFGMLGLLNPGLWLVGAGLELGYLFWLIHDPRFRRLVDGGVLGETQREWQRKIADQVSRLGSRDRAKYQALEARCLAIIDQQGQAGSHDGLDAQADGLSRLLWIYLRLLQTQQSISRIGEGDAGESERLVQRAKELDQQLKGQAIGEDLRKSLAGQLDIVQQRLVKRREAGEKLAFVTAEIERIEEQVELIREQAMLAADPQVVSQRIDEVAATLGGTSDWIRDQQQVFGQVEDLLSAPPPLLAAKARGRQTQ